MNIHYFQHASFEGLGIIEDWIRKPGNSITATKFFEDQRLPFVDLFDALIIMGGPMGVGDESKYNWMTPEKKLIEKAIKANKKVLGICLGAQLIADVLGAKVYKNTYKEIGWWNINYNNDLNLNQLGLPSTQRTFHWHGDTFDLPKGSQKIASSEACENQGFLLDNNVMALQYHMEVTASSIRAFLNAGKGELAEEKFVQSESVIVEEDEQTFNNNHSILKNVFEKFIFSAS
ncbi:MAG TPA: type 1 glutamine amidotransferase [Cytophagaceae bacterium]|jgi:GMP synthase (glutamine-hydrolysing)